MPAGVASPSEQLRRVSHNRTHSVEQRWANEQTDNSFTQELSPPPPAALTSRPYPRSIPLSAEEQSHPARQTRTHQRSLTELIPQFPQFPQLVSYRSNPTSPSRSPIKEISKKEFEDEFMPTLTGDRDNTVKVSDRSRGGGGSVSSWFTGASSPLPLGVPLALEQNLPTQTTKLQKRRTPQSMEPYGSIPATPSSATSMFGGFFSSTPKSPARVQISPSLNDEYLTLDVAKALFPTGQPDPFSPSAFKNLLINAEGLLSNLQTAYKIRTIALNELVAEKEAQSEEFEEVEIRARSLKSQLEDMSQQLSRKDALIKELSESLVKEKQLRAEEAHARERSIALVKAKASKDYTQPINSPTYSEDLGFNATTPTRNSNNRWRASYGSTDISEDDEPPAVFSRSMSPTSLSTTNSSVLYMDEASNDSRAEIGEASFARVVNNPRVSAFSPEQVKPKQQQSTFQKVLSGMSGKEKDDSLGMGSMQCSNCQGRDASFAWDTVGLLKAENKGLKIQVGKLEEGVNSALDAVLGFGLP